MENETWRKRPIRDLIAMHRSLTLYLASVESKERMRKLGIQYSVTLPSQPERHPEWEACK